MAKKKSDSRTLSLTFSSLRTALEKRLHLGRVKPQLGTAGHLILAQEKLDNLIEAHGTTDPPLELIARFAVDVVVALHLAASSRVGTLEEEVASLADTIELDLEETDDDETNDLYEGWATEETGRAASVQPDGDARIEDEQDYFAGEAGASHTGETLPASEEG